MGKQKNYGSYSLREWSGLFANPLASKLADVFSKTPPARQAGLVQCFFWMLILGTFLISSKARKAGPLAERVGDVVSQSRGSSLVKGFENATAARNSGRRPASLLHPCSSVLIRVIRGLSCFFQNLKNPFREFERFFEIIGYRRIAGHFCNMAVEVL